MRPLASLILGLVFSSMLLCRVCMASSRLAVTPDYAVVGDATTATVCLQQSRRGSWVTPQKCLTWPPNGTHTSTLGSVVATDGASMIAVADSSFAVVRTFDMTLGSRCNITSPAPSGTSTGFAAVDIALNDDGTLLVVASSNSPDVYLFATSVSGCPAAGSITFPFSPEHLAWLNNATVLATNGANITVATITNTRGVYRFSTYLPWPSVVIASVHAVLPAPRAGPRAVLGVASSTGADGVSTPSSVLCAFSVVSMNLSCSLLRTAPATNAPFTSIAAPWISNAATTTSIDMLITSASSPPTVTLSVAVDSPQLSRKLYDPSATTLTTAAGANFTSNPPAIATVLTPNPIVLYAVGTAVTGAVIDGPPQDCVWGNWSQFSPCSASCGTGSMVRTRSVVSWNQFFGRPCEGLSEDVAACQYYTWSVSAAGPCFQTSCGAGVRAVALTCKFCDTTVVDSSYCAGTDPPPVSLYQPCDPVTDAATLLSPYTVQMGPWSLDDDECKNVALCGVPRTRAATCVACDGSLVSSAFCGAAGSTTETQQCPCSSSYGGGIGCFGTGTLCSDTNVCVPNNPCPNTLLVCHDLSGNYYSNPYVCGPTPAPPPPTTAKPVPVPVPYYYGGCFLGQDAEVMECDPFTSQVTNAHAALSGVYAGRGPEFQRRYVMTGVGCEPVVAMLHRDSARPLPDEFPAVRICSAPSGRCVVMSYEHVMLDADDNAILALYVKPNVTQVRVANVDGDLHVETVTSVDVVPSPVGLFVPLTPSGTVVVNGLVASCFTYNIIMFNYHSAKSLLLSPLMPSAISRTIAWLFRNVVRVEGPIPLEGDMHPQAKRMIYLLGAVGIAGLWCVASVLVWLMACIVMRDAKERRRIVTHSIVLLAAFATSAWWSVRF